MLDPVQSHQRKLGDKSLKIMLPGTDGFKGMSSLLALKELPIYLGDAKQHMKSKMTIIDSNNRHNRREAREQSTIKGFTDKNSI